MLKTYMRIDERGDSFETFETEGDITEMFHPSIIWVDITDIYPQPQVGWIWDGAKFSPPPVVIPDPRPMILAELEQIDRESARPLRALILANPDIGVGTEERSTLEALEVRAADLRARLEELPE